MRLPTWLVTALALLATLGRGIPRAAVFAVLMTAAHLSSALAQEQQPPSQNREQAEQVDDVFDSNGVKIRYVTAGTGEAVVLIHGWMGDSSMWGTDGKGNTKLKGADGFQAIALDCRGHGKSDKPHDQEKYGAEMAADVVRLLDHLKIEKAHLIGYSSGAFIAGKVAATHPERVRGVVYGGQAPVIASKVKPTDFSECDVFAKAVDEGEDLGSYIIAITPEGRPKPTEEQAKAIANFMFNGKDVNAFAAAGRSFKDLAVSEDDLKKCQAPILFIHGGNESAHVKGRVAMVHKLLGRGEIKIVEGGDHMTTLAKPDFASALMEFLRASTPASSAPLTQPPPQLPTQPHAQPDGLRALDGEPAKRDPYFTPTEAKSTTSMPKVIIRNIREDRAGNIWFATFGGPIRYDGKEFTNFSEEVGLARTRIFSLLEDRSGALWFGSITGGASRYDGKSFTKFTEKEGLADNSVTWIFEDRDGTIWFGTDNGVSRHDGKSMTNFTTKDGLVHNSVYTICQDASGLIWFGTQGGVCSYDGRSFSNLADQVGRSFANIRAMVVDRSGMLWFGGQEGAFRYDGKTVEAFTPKEGLLDGFVGSMIVDRAGNIWLGHPGSFPGGRGGGASRYDGKSFKHFTQKEGLGSLPVYALLEDTSGNIWFGSADAGASRYDGNAFTNFSATAAPLLPAHGGSK